MRKELFSVGELTVDSIIGGGVSPYVRRTIYLDPTNGSDGNTGKAITRPVKTLAAARARITTGKNDRIILLQNASLAGVSSGISLAADPAWTENMCSLIGSGPGMQGQRSRIGMATDYGDMLTIGTAGSSNTTGLANLFANLYFQHGVSTTHVTAIGTLINGNYNTFKRCHWNTPLSTGLAAEADYVGVKVAGTGFQLFEECTFGGLGIPRSGANSNVILNVGTNTLFRNCIFLAYLGDGYPYFVKVANTSGLTQAKFENCKFMAMSSSMAISMAEAFAFTGTATCAIMFDSLCTFMKVTAIAAAGARPYIWVPAGAATDKMTSVVLS